MNDVNSQKRMETIRKIQEKKRNQLLKAQADKYKPSIVNPSSVTSFSQLDSKNSLKHNEISITSNSAPYISIITPTYNNRINFLNILSYMISIQTFPLELVEWIIVDDSNILRTNHEMRTKYIEYFANHPLQSKLFQLIYLPMKKAVPIGKKRNICKNVASGEIFVNFDDDDYYSANYLLMVANLFIMDKRINVVGASKITCMYQNSSYLQNLSSKGPTRTCAGIMSCRKKYAEENHFDYSAKYAEERSFLKGFTEPIFQLEYKFNVYMYNLVLCHCSNTVNKDNLKSEMTEIQWFMVIPDVYIIYFYLLQNLQEFQSKKNMTNSKRKIINPYMNDFLTFLKKEEEHHSRIEFIEIQKMLESKIYYSLLKLLYVFVISNNHGQT